MTTQEDRFDISLREYLERHPSRYARPFAEEATITIHNNDCANAVWTGDVNLPVPFSYCNLPMIENLPWKLLEVLDEPYRETRWFKRADANTCDCCGCDPCLFQSRYD